MYAYARTSEWIDQNDLHFPVWIDLNILAKNCFTYLNSNCLWIATWPPMYEFWFSRLLYVPLSDTTKLTTKNDFSSTNWLNRTTKYFFLGFFHDRNWLSATNVWIATPNWLNAGHECMNLRMLACQKIVFGLLSS